MAGLVLCMAAHAFGALAIRSGPPHAIGSLHCTPLCISREEARARPSVALLHPDRSLRNSSAPIRMVSTGTYIPQRGMSQQGLQRRFAWLLTAMLDPIRLGRALRYKMERLLLHGRLRGGRRSLSAASPPSVVRAHLRSAGADPMPTPTRSLQPSAGLSKPHALETAPGAYLSPSRDQVERRHSLIRRLVWLDTESLVERFAKTMAWDWGKAVQQHMQHLEHRSPLYQWHLRHNSPLAALPVEPPEGVSPTDALSLMMRRPTPEEKCEELKAALLRITPAFFSLTAEAMRLERAAVPRLSRRVARAVGVLGAWHCSRFLGVAPRKKYAIMNAFLRQLVETIADCNEIINAAAADPLGDPERR